MSLAQDKPLVCTTEKDRATILEQIKKLVTARHINVRNLDLDYEEWAVQVNEHAQKLIQTADPAAFEAGIDDLLRQLGSSHTAFFHQRRDQVPAPYSINATLRAIRPTGDKKWMFVDVLEGGAADRAGIRPGEILFSLDSKRLIPPDPVRFQIGGHHRVEIGNISGNTRVVDVDVPNKAAKDRPPMIEPRSLSHRMLTSDVGLVKIASFPGAVGQAFAHALDQTIDDLKCNGMQRLIIDVRGNVGGGLGSLRLMSYLCPGKVEIGHSVTRKRLRAGYKKEELARIAKIPMTKPALLLMALRFGLFQRDRSIVLVTEGLGPQPFHGRVVVLVNEHSHSAAETVASFAKENNLATIVGTNTAGEVLGGANFKLRNGYRLRIPVAGWYTWQGHCVEGKGVVPDFNIENTPEDLAARIDRQLQASIEVVGSLPSRRASSLPLSSRSI
jgi:carboxyl-terminal processing protease